MSSIAKLPVAWVEPVVNALTPTAGASTGSSMFTNTPPETEEEKLKKKLAKTGKTAGMNTTRSALFGDSLFNTTNTASGRNTLFGN